jgi:phosphoribosylglycinamide formyltransferase-1
MEQLIRYFHGHEKISVVLVISNKADANALNRAQRLGVEARYAAKKEFTNGEILKLLQSHKIDFIILAGFLLLVPISIIHAYPDRIINLHPALLPKHGGKGMYGMHVHEAVVRAGDKKSGITIHLVNEHFDEGKIIAQHEVNVSPGDAPSDVMHKVRELEHKYLAPEIEKVLVNLQG